MRYFIITIIGIAIIWVIVHHRNKVEQEKAKELEKTKASSLKVNIPGVEKTTPTVAKPSHIEQVPLDVLYANSHGMWVCACCETLNDDGAIKCSACGANK